MPTPITGRVEFHFLEKCPLRERTRLKAFITGMFRSEKQPFRSLSYIFCSDDYLLNINRSFLKHDFYTDIVTFDLSEKKGGTIGEIYISTDRVKENAGKLGTTFNNELHRVIFHGVLHLCGFRDKKKSDKLLMTAMEDKYLNKYFD